MNTNYSNADNSNKPRNKSLYQVQPVILSNCIGKSLKSTEHKGDDSVAEKKYVDAPRKTEWTSIYLGGSITLMTSMQFSLYFTSLWPYLKILDPLASETFFGVIIASYSFSQIIASPILGYWSNQIRCLKLPLQVCAWFMFTGNMIYVCAEVLPLNPKYTLVIARFVTGIGATTLGLMKAYASSASINKDRSRAIAFVTGGMAIGTTAGPGMQLFFTKIGYPGWRWTRNFAIHMFNAPALFCCLANIVTLLLLKFFFRESFVGVLNKKKKKEKTLEEGSDILLPKYDRLAVGVCYALRFTQMFVLTNFETIGASFAMLMFSWTATDAVFYVSIGHAVKSIFAFIVYLFYIAFDMGKRINDRFVCLLCVIVFFVLHLVTFSWPFLPNFVHLYNSTALDDESYIMNDNAVGCDVARYDWCESLTSVNVYVYYVFMCVSIGFAGSNINVALNTLFSRIIGPRFMGTQQGLLQMFGGSARMFGPLLVGFLYANYGPRLTWIMEMVVLGVMGTLWCVYYKRLVPLIVPPELVKQDELDGAAANAERIPKTIILTDDLQEISQNSREDDYNDEDESEKKQSTDSKQDVV